MKTYKINLTNGETLTFKGTKMTRDGGGVHIYDDAGSLVAGFMYQDVASAYEIQ